MNKTAFVTGGTGFLGQHLITQLVADGWLVYALHRSLKPDKSNASSSVMWVRAALDDAQKLAAVMPDVPFTVFHLAADTTQWKRNFARQTKTNVKGTRNLLLAAKTKNAERFIHVSSITAFGQHNKMIDEQTPSVAANSGHNYALTKWQAEQLVKQAVAAGEMDAVILNPCHIIGPGDTQNWIQIFRAIKDDKLPGVPPAGGNFGFVVEIAKALIVAAEKGQKGENYILGGPQLSFLQIVQEAQRQLHKPVSKKASPKALFYFVEPLMRLGSFISGKEPLLTPDKVKLITHHLEANDKKARKALHYKHKPLEEMVAETLAWLAKQM
jgi:dihydroflavonol-4-reductase